MMTLYLNENVDAQDIRANATAAGVTGVALSLGHVCVVSTGGGVVIGEAPGAPPSDAEQQFLPQLRQLSNRFPNLKIVLEHVSTAAGVETVKALSTNVAATITAHHLELTVDDVMSRNGSGITQPHNYCKPLAKNASDREALRQAVEHPKFFLGSDSAPHPIESKQVTGGCAAGVFTSAYLIAYLCDTFYKMNRSKYLYDFTCARAADFFGFPRKGLEDGKPYLRISRDATRVADSISSPLTSVVPFKAGEFLAFSVNIEIFRE
eukprot:GHVS01029412.1.p1 GENE.GHVS01029412.1~~GHVS01029412.1.p1  ORF type:complete len:264 (+),score=17.92 GHVS01029412.1:273-1064(+)